MPSDTTSLTPPTSVATTARPELPATDNGQAEITFDHRHGFEQEALVFLSFQASDMQQADRFVATLAYPRCNLNGSYPVGYQPASPVPGPVAADHTGFFASR